jgi:hypothetical protein|tara:strand:- start:283 stop:456 length:174 start_codon:yes stop_codon:yes gene_type:complete
MSKKTLKGRTQLKGHVGKLYGRSHGEMVYNEQVGHKVTPKIDAAIKKNLEKKSCEKH